MRRLVLLLCFLSTFSFAEMVDTYQFKNNDDRNRAVALAKSLRCPQCQNQNLVESNSPIAYDLRLEVYQMVNEGKSNEQIVATLTERFGDFVRYDPPFKSTTLLLWGLPFVLLILSACASWFYLKRRDKSGSQLNSQLNSQLSVEQQAELKKLLEKVE